MVFYQIENFHVTETGKGIYFIIKDDAPPSQFAAQIKFITYNSVMLFIYVDSKEVYGETLSLGDDFKGYSCSSIDQIFRPAREMIRWYANKNEELEGQLSF